MPTTTTNKAPPPPANRKNVLPMEMKDIMSNRSRRKHPQHVTDPEANTTPENQDIPPSPNWAALCDDPEHYTSPQRVAREMQTKYGSSAVINFVSNASMTLSNQSQTS